MAFQSAVEMKRSDSFKVNPFDIKVNEDLRGRQFAPADSAIVALATSMLDQTQLNPVQVRKLPDGNLQLVAGFTRTAAARLIRDGFTDLDGNQRQDAEFLIKCVPTVADDKESFIANVVENALRNETSPIDDAFNQERLRERYGKTDQEIAKLYGYPNSNKVSRLKKLLMLSGEERELVHTGAMGVQAAIDMLELPAEARAAIVAEAKEKGKVNGADIVRQVREHHLNDDGKAPEAGGESGEAGGDTGEGGDETVSGKKGLKPLSIREIRKFCTATMEVEGQDENLIAVTKALLEWVNGKRKDRSFTNALKKFGGIEATAAKAA